ncbi:urease accessory protein UreE [Alphaproteobacteria bacterium]|nr:urease accessory protein UreE [Alphaproteobacteria bacterium]
MLVKSWKKKGDWPLNKVKYQITLVACDRLCRRKNLILDNGMKVFLALDRVVNFKNGDALELENGLWVEIIAAKEKVIDIISLNNMHQSLLAWHLGNRHLAVQIIDEKKIRIEYDHVIFDMMKGLKAELDITNNIFEPELGAYGSHNH